MDIPYVLSTVGKTFNNYDKKTTLPKMLTSYSLILFEMSARPPLKIIYNTNVGINYYYIIMYIYRYKRRSN